MVGRRTLLKVIDLGEPADPTDQPRSTGSDTPVKLGPPSRSRSVAQYLPHWGQPINQPVSPLVSHRPRIFELRKTRNTMIMPRSHIMQGIIALVVHPGHLR